MDIFREHNSGKTCTRSIILTGTSDFGKVERTSATISGVGYPLILSTFKSQLRGTKLQKREELVFAVRRAVAKFGMDFYKDVCSEWVERHMQYAVCGGSYFEKECTRHELNKTLINRRRQHDVPKCSVRPYDPNFICIL